MITTTQVIRQILDDSDRAFAEELRTPPVANRLLRESVDEIDRLRAIVEPLERLLKTGKDVTITSVTDEYLVWYGRDPWKRSTLAEALSAAVKEMGVSDAVS